MPYAAHTSIDAMSLNGEPSIIGKSVQDLSHSGFAISQSEVQIFYTNGIGRSVRSDQVNDFGGHERVTQR